MRKLLLGILIIILALCSICVYAEETANVKVNGIEVKFDQAPIVIDGRTLVPIRAVAEQMGAEVRWNDNTQTTTVIYKNIAVGLQVNNIKMTVVTVNTMVEKQIELDLPPQTYNGRMLLPIRAVVEQFGCSVGWDANANCVIITTPDYTPEKAMKAIIIGE